MTQKQMSSTTPAERGSESGAADGDYEGEYGGDYDVVVVGGAAAGLSGALTLARARRRVAVVDGGEPRNASAGHVHSYLGREGAVPADLYADGRREVQGYGGTVLEGSVEGISRTGDGRFRVALADGRTLRARKVLAATGVTDELPAVPGLAGRWGRDVLHCPFCHGWEVRDEPIGILAVDLGAAMHQALLWRQWSEDVVLFLRDAGEPDEGQAARLSARGIRVVRGAVAAVEGGSGAPVVVMDDGRRVPRRAIVVLSRLQARAGYLATLGLEPVDQVANGLNFGTAVPAGSTGATAVPGVYAAGNLAAPMIQVLPAAAAGQAAAAALVAELMMEEVEAAVGSGAPVG